MRTETALTWTLVGLFAYAIWRSTRPDVSLTEAKPLDDAPKESPKEDIPVEVVESTKVSANASVTQPSFSEGLFRKDWVTMQGSMHDSKVTYSGFN